MSKVPSGNPLILKKNQPSQECLEQINQTQDYITEVNTSLHDLLEHLLRHRSILTRMSEVWGQWPIWLKLLLGGVVFGGFLVMGIFMQVPILIALTSVIGVIALFFGISLDNHYSIEHHEREGVRHGIHRLGTLFGNIIKSLESIRQQFSEEIDRLEEQNDGFKQNIQSLMDEIAELKNQLVRLDETTQRLMQTEQALSGTKNELQTLKIQLEHKMGELNELEADLGLKINTLVSNNLMLKGTIRTYLETVTSNKETQLKFLGRLETFLEKQDSNFHGIIDRICDAETELMQVKTELQQCADRYEKLLNSHAKQVQRFTRATDKMVGHHATIHRPFRPKPRMNKQVLESTLASKLTEHGFYKPLNFALKNCRRLEASRFQSSNAKRATMPR